MTRFNNKYPYTDFHELNADWLLDTVQDAAADAKEAAETVETYDARLTVVEDDLTNNVGPAINTLQSEVETPTTGLLDRVTAVEGDISNTITPDISTLQSEVETPTTGLLDRVTALENQPVPSANAVYYLEFDSSLVSIDPDNAYDIRIEYDWLKQFVPLNTSGEDTHVIKLYDSHTQKVYDLAGFHLQESASPDGLFVFTNRIEHMTGGVIDYYVNSTVTVLQNGSNPTFNESVEMVLPEVSVADAGSFLAVDENGEWGLDAPVVPAIESGSITYSHANINATAYWYKVGDVVTVTTLFHADYNGLTGALFTLPYVPKAGFGETFYCSSSSADLKAWVSGSDGEVSLQTTTSATYNYGISFSYVVA